MWKYVLGAEGVMLLLGIAWIHTQDNDNARALATFPVLLVAIAMAVLDLVILIFLVAERYLR